MYSHIGRVLNMGVRLQFFLPALIIIQYLYIFNIPYFSLKL